MGKPFALKPKRLCRKYNFKCVYCDIYLYTSEMSYHVVKCGKLYSSTTQQQKKIDILNFLGEKSITIDLEQQENVKLVVSLYYFFYALRITHNIKAAFRNFDFFDVKINITFILERRSLSKVQYRGANALPVRVRAFPSLTFSFLTHGNAQVMRIYVRDSVNCLNQ